MLSCLDKHCSLRSCFSSSVIKLFSSVAKNNDASQNTDSSEELLSKCIQIILPSSESMIKSVDFLVLLDCKEHCEIFPSDPPIDLLGAFSFESNMLPSDLQKMIEMYLQYISLRLKCI